MVQTPTLRSALHQRRARAVGAEVAEMSAKAFSSIGLLLFLLLPAAAQLAKRLGMR